jgi:glycosyltransferase involved in cell wall biosynthesis
MDCCNKNLIIVSAQNIIEGGPLTVLLDLYSWASNNAKKEFIFIINSKSLMPLTDYQHIKYIEVPFSKKYWINRVIVEYLYFFYLSLKLKPFLWFSLHDISPNVRSSVRAVYCHNATFIYKTSFKDFFVDKKTYLFSKFYRHLYKINIRKNKHVYVQQHWMANEFQLIYGIKNIIVAPLSRKKDYVPNKIKINDALSTHIGAKDYPNRKLFLFPSYPRPFKNFEVICEAFEQIDKNLDCCVLLTIDGSENVYAKNIVAKYGQNNKIKFIGIQPRSTMPYLYEKVDALIFPSKLETWGLPLSEFSLTGKPIFASDMPHCNETLLDYENACYFEPDDSNELCNMLSLFVKDKEFMSSKSRIERRFPEAVGWDNVFSLLLKINP